MTSTVCQATAKKASYFQQLWISGAAYISFPRAPLEIPQKKAQRKHEALFSSAWCWQLLLQKGMDFFFKLASSKSLAPEAAARSIMRISSVSSTWRVERQQWNQCFYFCGLDSSASWCFQPIWKNMSQNGKKISHILGVKIFKKYVSCHHLVISVMSIHLNLHNLRNPQSLSFLTFVTRIFSQDKSWWAMDLGRSVWRVVWVSGNGEAEKKVSEVYMYLQRCIDIIYICTYYIVFTYIIYYMYYLHTA